MTGTLPTPRQGWVLLGIVATIGHALKKVEEFFFDYMLYPIVIAWAIQTYGTQNGLIAGGVIMSLASAAVCMFWLWLYFLLKVDFLAIEYARLVRDHDSDDGFWSTTRSFFLQSKLFAFIFLSLTQDPFVTVAYVRHGNSDQYDGLSFGDWIIFWLSVLLANAWWTGLMGVGVELLNELSPGAISWMLDELSKVITLAMEWLRSQL